VASALDRKHIPQEGDVTRHTDCHVRALVVGDRLLGVPRHDNACCEHRVTCTIRWNSEWQALGLQADDGTWISGMGIVSGYQRERQ
jgi:hypothetical protein